MDVGVSVHSNVSTMPVPQTVIDLNSEIMALQATFDLFKGGLSEEDKKSLESAFDLWRRRHKRYVETPVTVERSLNPSKILRYMWSKAQRRRKTFKLYQLADTTKFLYVLTSSAVRAEDLVVTRRETSSIALPNDRGAVPPLAGSHGSGMKIRALSWEDSGDSSTVNDLLPSPQDITSSDINISNEHLSGALGSHCAVCHIQRDHTDLSEIRNYYVCSSTVEPKCGRIAKTVDRIVEECVLGINKRVSKISDSQECIHGEFFDKFRIILVTDHHGLAANFVLRYKDNKEFTQLALDTMQEILDTKLSSKSDWRKPSIIRTRLCRLLGNFARECDHISFPSSLAVTVEPVTRPPPTGGGFAIVSFGYLLPDKITMVAIKTQKIRSPEENDHDRNYSKRFLYELMMWRNMSHRGIAKFIGFSTDDTTHALVIQYFQNGSLEGYLPGYLNKTPIETIRIDCRRWILDVAEGLLYLHLQGYAHGDIHGGNILLDENLHAVISDFGTAVYHDAPWYSNGSVEGRGGRRHFLAPELLPELDNPYDLKDKRPTKAGDVFSFGSVSSQMHNGSHAYNFPDKESPANIIFVKIEHIRKFWEDGRSIQKPHFKSTMEYMEDGLWNILSSCFHFHPQDRPGIEDIFRQLVSYFGIHECGCGIQSCDRGDRSSLLLFND
ncbi:kinase-like domain-containing protein [Abortiporus biennis]|nr:kinase-like domain-containing protein [Abortiporus biennis]